MWPVKGEVVRGHVGVVCAAVLLIRSWGAGTEKLTWVYVRNFSDVDILKVGLSTGSYLVYLDSVLSVV